MTTTPNTAASGAADALRAAITRAFHLGQIYWQQADSESCAEQDKSDSTYKKYKALLEETCTPLAASAPVAPTQPATPKGFVLVPVEATEDMKAAAVKYANGTAVYKNVAAAALRIEEGIYGEVYEAMIAAAPKADHIPEAGKMLGDLLARIHGDGGHYASEHGIEKAVADADRILAEWRAYKPAPLQQGEYLPLPISEGTVYCNPDGSLMIDASLAFFDGAKIGDKLYTADQVRAAIDADRAARGAAQAAPDVVEELIRERDHRDEIIDALCEAVLEDRPEWSSDYYFEDAVVAVQERIAELEVRKECRDLNAQAAPAPVVEDVESFDTWLVKQFEFRNYYFTQRGPGLMAVPFARRAYEAGQAAQPEGGAR